MDLSDAETSDSTSSSSFGPGSAEYASDTQTESAAAAGRLSQPRQAHKGGEVQSASGYVRSASTPPSYLREADGEGQSRQEGPVVRGRYGASREGEYIVRMEVNGSLCLRVRACVCVLGAVISSVSRCNSAFPRATAAVKFWHVATLISRVQLCGK